MRSLTFANAAHTIGRLALGTGLLLSFLFLLYGIMAFSNPERQVSVWQPTVHQKGGE